MSKKDKPDSRKDSKKDRKKDAKAKATPGADIVPLEKAAEEVVPAMPKFKHVAKKKLSTGKGATAAEVGKSLVELFNAGKAEEVEKLWHHKKIESIEADGSVFLGRKGITEKNVWWYGNFEVHSGRAEGPFVGATGFVVHFTIDCTPKGGARMTSREVGVYTVEKGKIIREEFMGLLGDPA